jgi:replication-associated recombination protein RarA
MKSMGYGRDYKYAHDYEGGVANQEHLPEKLKGRKVYKPGPRDLGSRPRGELPPRPRGDTGEGKT